MCAIHVSEHQSFSMSKGGFVLTREEAFEHHNKTEGIIRQVKLSVFTENTQDDILRVSREKYCFL